MAGWKELNFVPDSDEEEDLLTVDTQVEYNASHKDFIDIDDLVEEPEVIANDLSTGVLGERDRGKDGGEKDGDEESDEERDDTQVQTGITPATSEHDDTGSFRSRLGSGAGLETAGDSQDNSQEESEDEFALPMPRSPPVSKEALRPLDHLFSDDQEPEEPSQDNLGQSAPQRHLGCLDTPSELELHQDFVPTTSKITTIDTSIPSLPGNGISMPSSPLTDLSSIDSSSQRLMDESLYTSANGLTDLRSRVSHQTSDVYLAENTSRSSARRFRARKAIQLNPYAIESELYKTALKSRGMKPIQIRPELEEGNQQTETSSADASDNDDTQTQNYYEYRDPSFPPSNLPPRLSSPLDNDDDLPDVEDFLRSMKPEAVPNGFKRRKVAHTYSRTKERMALDVQQHSITEDMTAPVSELQEPMVISSQAPLPSPSSLSLSRPSSGGQMDTFAHFRYPIGMTPPQLQTPAISSETRTRTGEHHIARSNLEDNSGNEMHSPTNLDSLESSSVSSQSGTEVEDESQVLLAQRKIRGVLPASWIRLDQKNQRQKLKRNEQTNGYFDRSPGREMHRGVARPLSSYRRRPDKDSMGFESFLVSDGSVSELETSKNAGVRRQAEEVSLDTREHRGALLVYDSDSMEDNQIDSMLQTSSRTRRTPRRKPRRRQTKLTDHLQPSKPRAHSQDLTAERPLLSPSKHLGTEMKRSRTKRRKLNHKTQRHMHVVNPSEPDSEQTDRDSTTRRVKHRQGQRRESFAKDSPRHGAEALLVDAHESLPELESGEFNHDQGYGAAARKRRPLQVRSGNEQDLRYLISESDSVDEHAPTHTLGELKSRPTKPQQRRIDAFVNTTIPSAGDDRNQVTSETRKQRHRRQRGQIWSHIQPLDSTVPAMLETEQQHSRHPKKRRKAQNPVLERYLEPSEPPDSTGRERNIQGYVKDHELLEEHLPPSLDRNRRRRVQFDPQTRLDGELYSPDLASGIASMDSYTDNNVSALTANDDVILGLGPYGTEYPISFDTKRLPDGLCFEQTTLLGSGTFQKSLVIRDLDIPQVSLRISFRDFIWDWGSWNETVSSQIGSIVDQVLAVLTTGHSDTVGLQEAVDGLESIIQYLTAHLHFLDPIDRKLFLDRCLQLMTRISSIMNGQEASDTKRHRDLTNALIQISSRYLIIVSYLSHVAHHHLASSDHKTSLKHLVKSALDQTVCAIFHDGFDDFQNGTRSTSNHSPGGVSRSKEEAFVIVHHILQQNQPSHMNIWEVLQGNNVFVLPPAKPVDVRVLDAIWRRMFSILPLITINCQGEVSSSEEGVPPQNWKLVKQLIDPVLAAYLTGYVRQGLTFNAYCRSLFSRCFHLIREWNWIKCDSIIGNLFDFFAKNNLRHLRHEESHGSPTFLENLSEDLGLTAEKKDLCFHILLKIIGLGIRKMRSTFPQKTISNVSWRLIPNHNRQLPKDQAIRQEDLDEVRNHHDLLSTLYWATPSACRIRPAIIQRLVDLEASHKEACHISIRSWSSLVTFQISTGESLLHLDPFVQWHDDMLGKIIRQHRLARTEIERQAQDAEVSFGWSISKREQEWAIGSNQRHIESVLGHALGSLRRAIIGCQSLDIASRLLNPMLGQVLEMFDANQPRINNVIIQALEVVATFIERTQSLHLEDDSQGFGDLQEFEGLLTEENIYENTSQQPGDGIQAAPTSEVHAGGLSTLDVHKSLHDLLSNCFGADTIVDDVLLAKVIETWLLAAQHEIKRGTKCWDDYVGRYNNDSWNNLRKTEQTTKFTPLFLARIMDMDDGFYEQHKAWIFEIWMEGLVERESIIKFQDVLTKSLLKQDSPLLENPPFWRDNATGDFHVSLSDFRERRLSLLCCVLSNMRESISFMNYHGLEERGSQRRGYEDMLKHLMSTMKENYQSLGHGSDVRGAYVGFVHQVIDLLQQHTTEICPIDRFFMDLSSFPLPESDPTYVVSRLKNYGLRLHDPKIPRQLASFVHTVSERAAVDNQQLKLVAQLQASMQNEFEGAGMKITLRSFLVQVIVPAYTEVALGTTCGWVVAAPMLLALQPTLDDLLLDMDCTKLENVRPMELTLLTLLHSLQQSMALVVNHEGHLELARIIRVLTMYFALIVATSRPLDYFIRLGVESRRTVAFARYFRQFALFASARILDRLEYPHNLDGSAPLEDDLVWVPPGSKYHHARMFASQHLRETLSRNWKLQDDKCVFGSRREVVATDLRPVEEEASGFLAQVQNFMDALDRMPALGGSRRVVGMRTEEDVCRGLGELTF